MGPFTGHKGRLVVDHADDAVRRRLELAGGAAWGLPGCAAVELAHAVPCARAPGRA